MKKKRRKKTWNEVTALNERQENMRHQMNNQEYHVFKYKKEFIVLLNNLF